MFQGLPSALQARVRELQDDIEKEARGETRETTSALIPRIDRLKGELDDLIAGECVLCGSAMIRSIDSPFPCNTEEWLL